MNVEGMVLIFILMCGMGLMLLCNNSDTASTSIQDYPESSAIAKAKKQSSRDPQFVSLRKEASQFGLNLMFWEKDEYKQIRNRLFTNDQLASALKTVNQGGILIALNKEFWVHVGVVGIDVNATDNVIIKFLADSLPEAKARKASFEETRKEASQFGLNLMSWEEEKYKRIRNRLFANDQLASALRTVAREKIQVELSHEFRIGASVIDINVDASDEEIIRFLLGK